MTKINTMTSFPALVRAVVALEAARRAVRTFRRQLAADFPEPELDGDPHTEGTEIPPAWDAWNDAIETARGARGGHLLDDAVRAAEDATLQAHREVMRDAARVEKISPLQRGSLERTFAIALGEIKGTGAMFRARELSLDLAVKHAG